MPGLDQESILRQESRLIVLNLAVLAGIAMAHALFAPILGEPARLFFILLLVRFIMQIGELTWLQTAGETTSLDSLLSYSRLSIWMNLAFAFALSRASGIEDSHYVVLMVIPVIASAFRYGSKGVAIVVGTASLTTLLEVWLYYREHGFARDMEYFEAASVMLIYAVVAIVVSLLVRQVREERAHLEANLAELEATRGRLVAEEKLSAIGRLASGVAHEIRNPVAMIVSSAEMARRGGGGGLAREELDEIVIEEARRLERLTTDFLSYAGTRAPERKASDLASLIGYAADAIRSHATETGVRIEVHSCPAEPTVMLDPFQIHRALQNLLLNAVDATRRGGRVVLGVAVDGGNVALWVENEGDAIPSPTLERLFEPFFTTRERGTGLGLPIARSIARAHGGDVELSRNDPGAVRFTIHLPASVPDEAEAPCPGS